MPVETQVNAMVDHSSCRDCPANDESTSQLDFAAVDPPPCKSQEDDLSNKMHYHKPHRHHEASPVYTKCISNSGKAVLTSSSHYTNHDSNNSHDVTEQQTSGSSNVAGSCIGHDSPAKHFNHDRETGEPTTAEPLCGDTHCMEYFSYVNPAIDMGLDYSSQISIRPRDNEYIDRELLSKLAYPRSYTTVYPDRNTNGMGREVGRRSLRNLLILGAAFMCVFTAFVSIQSLQSTLNQESSVGVISLAAVYAATVVSCLLAPPIINKLTVKGTMVASFVLFLVYIVANIYPKGFILIPASLLLGFLSGPLWSAQATYVTTLALQYAQTTRTLHDPVLTRFTSVFMGMYQTSQVWGHIVSIVALSAGQSFRSSSTQSSNISSSIIQYSIPEVQHEHIPGQLFVQNIIINNPTCGPHDCGAPPSQPSRLPSTFPSSSLLHSAESLSTPTQAQLSTLPGHQTHVIHVGVRAILLAIHILVVVSGLLIIIFFLDKNQLNSSDVNSPPSVTSQQLFFATLHIVRQPCLLMLGPLILYIGMEQGFVIGDYTKSYVTCTLGMSSIGPVMICFGAVTAISSFVIGWMATHIKRFAIMAAGSAFSAGLFIVLRFWKPKHDDPPMFYVIAACMGVCDAIWQTQTTTLFGLLFTSTPEAAFACYRMIQACGLALAFGYSPLLCVRTKIYIMASTLTTGLFLYTIIEYRLHQIKKRMAMMVAL